MKPWFYPTLILLPLLTSGAALAERPADQTSNDLAASRSHLEQQRDQYRQTVAHSGRESAKARAARENLRSARRSYHQQRRTAETARRAHR